METRGKRTFRAAGPVEIPTPQVESAPQVAPAPQVEPASSETPAEGSIEFQTETAVALAAAAPGLQAAEVAVEAAASAPGAPRPDIADPAREAFAALAESRTALARGIEALSEEMTGLARSGIDTATRTAIGMLGARTVADAVAVNADFTRASFDNWVGSSAKFSEIGVQLAAEWAGPLLDRLGTGRLYRGWLETWPRAFHPGR